MSGGGPLDRLLFLFGSQSPPLIWSPLSVCSQTIFSVIAKLSFFICYETTADLCKGDEVHRETDNVMSSAQCLHRDS